MFFQRSDVDLPSSLTIGDPLPSDFAANQDLSLPGKRSSNQALPVTRPKLSKGTVVAISVAVVLVVVGIVIGVLFATVWKKKTPQRGPNQYGSISVEDETTRVQSPPYRPGDTLLVKYIPSATGFSNQVKLSFSDNNGRTWTDVTPITPEGNSAKYVIPENTFSDLCLFRAENTKQTDEFVTTSLFSVEPLFAITSGAGVKTGDKVYTGSRYPIKITLQLDTALPDLDQVSDWSVTTSTDKASFPSNANETVMAITLDKTKGTAELTWVASTPATQVYYQVETTSLPKNNYPRQLSVVSAFPIDIVSGTPSGPTPCGGNPNTFAVCKVIMVDSQGKSNIFLPGEAVTLEFQHDGTFSGTATWSYTVSGGSAKALTPTAGPSQPTAGVVTYTWTLPSTLFTDAFILTVTSEGQSAASPSYSVKPNFTWNAPNTGHTVLVAKTQSTIAALPFVNWLTTTVTFDASVAANYPNWSVSLGTPARAFTVLADRIYSAALVAGSTTQRSLVWYLEPDDFKAVGGMDAFVRFTTQNESQTETLVVTSSTTVAFTLSDFAPVAVPIQLPSSQCDVSPDGMSSGVAAFEAACPESKTLYHFVKDIQFNDTSGAICQFDSTMPNKLQPSCWSVSTESVFVSLPLSESSPNVSQVFTLVNKTAPNWAFLGSGPLFSGCAEWKTGTGHPAQGDPITVNMMSDSACPENNERFLWPADVF